MHGPLFFSALLSAGGYGMKCRRKHRDILRDDARLHAQRQNRCQHDDATCSLNWDLFMYVCMGGWMDG